MATITASNNLNGSTTSFNFPYKVLDESHIAVDIDGVTLGTSLYTIDGVGNSSTDIDIEVPSAANYTYDAGPPVVGVLTITLNIGAASQITTYSSATSVRPQVLNDEFGQVYTLVGGLDTTSDAVEVELEAARWDVAGVDQGNINARMDSDHAVHEAELEAARWDYANVDKGNINARMDSDHAVHDVEIVAGRGGEASLDARADTHEARTTALEGGGAKAEALQLDSVGGTFYEAGALPVRSTNTDYSNGRNLVAYNDIPSVSAALPPAALAGNVLNDNGAAWTTGSTLGATGNEVTLWAGDIDSSVAMTIDAVNNVEITSSAASVELNGNDNVNITSTAAAVDIDAGTGVSIDAAAGDIALTTNTEVKIISPLDTDDYIALDPKQYDPGISVVANNNLICGMKMDGGNSGYISLNNAGNLRLEMFGNDSTYDSGYATVRSSTKNLSIESVGDLDLVAGSRGGTHARLRLSTTGAITATDDIDITSPAVLGLAATTSHVHIDPGTLGDLRVRRNADTADYIRIDPEFGPDGMVIEFVDDLAFAGDDPRISVVVADDLMYFYAGAMSDMRFSTSGEIQFVAGTVKTQTSGQLWELNNLGTTFIGTGSGAGVPGEAIVFASNTTTLTADSSVSVQVADTWTFNNEGALILPDAGVDASTTGGALYRDGTSLYWYPPGGTKVLIA